MQYVRDVCRHGGHVAAGVATGQSRSFPGVDEDHWSFKSTPVYVDVTRDYVIGPASPVSAWYMSTWIEYCQFKDAAKFNTHDDLASWEAIGTYAEKGAQKIKGDEVSPTPAEMRADYAMIETEARQQAIAVYMIVSHYDWKDEPLDLHDAVRLGDLEEQNKAWTLAPLKACTETGKIKLQHAHQREPDAFGDEHHRWSVTSQVERKILDGATAVRNDLTACIAQYERHPVPDGDALLAEARAIRADAEAAVAQVDPNRVAAHEARDAGYAAKNARDEAARNRRLDEAVAEAVRRDKAEWTRCDKEERTRKGPRTDACQKALGDNYVDWTLPVERSAASAQPQVTRSMKTCPTCNGTGRWRVKIQSGQSNYNCSSDGHGGRTCTEGNRSDAQTAGTTCPVCGGSGQVPD